MLKEDIRGWSYRYNEKKYLIYSILQKKRVLMTRF